MAIEPEMTVIEAGDVVLGTPPRPPEVEMQHDWPVGVKVHVKRFAMARHAVTVREFQQFIAASGYSGPPQLDEPRFNVPQQPAVGLSWNDAVAYARWLADVTGKRYRLPSDAEWEKAARGGLEGKLFPWGDESPVDRCCFGLNKETGHPVSVGSYSPNGFGLYQMVGNVWQWCQDLYIDSPAKDPPTNTPTGKPARENRVLRGGSFMTEDSNYLRCAYRHEDPPDLRHSCLGMRLAMDV
jgi:formylglycine-generating enzyme required for sulfatase activity